MVSVLFIYIEDSLGRLKNYKVWGWGVTKLLETPPPQIIYPVDKYTKSQVTIEKQIDSVD